MHFMLPARLSFGQIYKGGCGYAFQQRWGCVIALSAEAKALGIAMGAPYFKIKDDLRLAVFSSNYAVYADMSCRVMDTL